jgi:hypothetical protein
MGIDLRRDRRRTVAQDFRHRDQRHTVSEQERRRRVPQIVEADGGQADTVEHTLEDDAGWCGSAFDTTMVNLQRHLLLSRNP